MFNKINFNNPEAGKKIDVKKIVRSSFLFVPLLLIILLGGTSTFLYFKNDQFKNWIQNNPLAQNQAEHEAKVLGAEVSKLVFLPEDETPTILTVSDVTKLKDQDFYKNAKNGDKVLIFLKAKKAILYDPDLKKIKEIGPLNLSQPDTSGTSIQTNRAKVALKNGTNITGLAVQTETELQKAFPGISIVSKDQTKNPNYDKTLIVVLNTQAKNAAGDIAKFYNALVGEFPPDEVVPNGADILIILGKDRAPAK